MARAISFASGLLTMTTEEDHVATADPHVLATAGEEQIKWIALEESQGLRYTWAKDLRPIPTS